MKKEELDIWSNITFKTKGYHKNFDMINVNESIISEYNGTISSLRLFERKPPVIIGEYGISVWNMVIGKMFGADINKLIKEHSLENTYNELFDVIDNNLININDYEKIILIHTLIIHPNFRKHGITEEFIEFMHREFYSKNNAIIALVKPFQDNPMDADYFLNHKNVEIKNSAILKPTIVSATEYYSLKKFMKKEDTEMNEYKLFSIANRCGFNRIGNSHLFIYTPDKTIKRMMEKHRNKEITSHNKYKP